MTHHSTCHRPVDSCRRAGLRHAFAILFSLSTFTGRAWAQDAEWTLLWSDEFSVAGPPDAANWRYQVGNGWHPLEKRFMGRGNWELEFYRPEQCTVRAGALRLTAKLQVTRVRGQEWNVRSCRITTARRFSMQEGAIEVHVAVPARNGFWPAAWMLGDACNDSSTPSYRPVPTYVDRMATNWPACGEIDLMEMRDREARVFQGLHWDARSRLLPYRADKVLALTSVATIRNPTAYHVYRIEWSANSIAWYVDGRRTMTQSLIDSSMEEFTRPFHLLLDLAAGGLFVKHAPAARDFPG